MLFHCCRLLLVLPFWLFFIASVNAQNANAQNGLQLEASGEETSGIFWDSDTLQTQTAPLLTIKVTNQTAQASRVHLRWQIADSSGQKRVQKSGDYNLDGRGFLLIRELFAATQRGAYLLTIQARRQGSEKWSYSAWPFAITVKPQAGFRPQSFFALDAPILLDDAGLDFYARCGTRVLRSEILGAGGSDVPRGALDNQMRARLERNLATLGVLRQTQNADAAPWVNRALPILTRYAAVKTWEIDSVNRVQRESHREPLADFAQAVFSSAHAARPDAAWVWPLEIGNKVLPGGTSVTMTPLGLRASGDLAPQAAIPGGLAHPEALRRALLSASSTARNANSGLHIRAQMPQSQTPLGAAGDLVGRYALAIMAGASGMSVELADDKTAASAQCRYAQAAALSQMTKLLEDAAYVEDLFPRSPALCGALFQAGQNSIALIWPARNGTQAPLFKTRLPGARIFDVFGNPMPGRDQWTLPLTAPIYIVSSAAPSTLTWGLRNSKIEGITPVAARALPLTQVISGAPARIRVRLQNVLLQPASGVVRLKPPPGWMLSRNEQKFALGAGEIRDFEFLASRSVPSRDGLYPVTVALDVPSGSGAWSQELRVACAANTRSNVRLDADLREWKRSQWMEIRPATAKQTARPEAKVEAARVALAWDESYLYVAAHIQEPRLRASVGNASANNASTDADALQLAFGTRGEGRPEIGPFRDTDWSLILSAQGGGQIIMPGFTLPREARCIARRDERHSSTFYEAAIPLTALPNLNPGQRAASAESVRFGWVLRNDEGAPLEWSAAVSVFQWWRNPASFAPDSRLFLAAQMPLGFAREGVVNRRAPAINAETPAPPVGETAPRRNTQNSKPPTGRSSPGNGILAPMPPSLLPPVKEPDGKPILPTAPNVSVSRMP